MLGSVYDWGTGGPRRFGHVSMSLNKLGRRYSHMQHGLIGWAAFTFELVFRTKLAPSALARYTFG